MLLTSLITAAEEGAPEAVIPPAAIGALTLAILLVLLVGLLWFGGGREHS